MENTSLASTAISLSVVAVIALFLVAVILVGVVTLFPPTWEKTQYTSSCKDFNVECEKAKDHQFVKILDDDNVNKYTFIDCYGSLLNVGEWYSYTAISRVLIPVSFDSSRLGFTYYDFENAEDTNVSSNLRANGKISSDTTSISCMVFTTNNQYLPIKVKMLLFGPRRLAVGFDGKKTAYRIPDTNRSGVINFNEVIMTPLH